MFDGRAVTESRIRRFTREHLLPAIHPETAAVTLTAHRLPGEPIPPREAIAAGAEYAPIELGAPLGRAWSTTWLHVTGTVPAHWASDDASAPELLVDLAFTHPDDLPGTVDAAREALRPALSRPAGDSSLTVLATGHAHIDSAWLWPVRETGRKVARTFSTVCTLLEEDPEATFSASSAQQYRWLRDRYPELFGRIREHVASGRFVPVGGMWVESDTNMPGSEAMARQFVAGKRFFLEEFGVETRETWLPDSFGYSAALPQIAALAGNENFLTQKVSWNQTNTFPHHTFRWEGIDGTDVFTHFPPADTYNGELTGEELARFERNFKEKGRATLGMDLFRHGDGGGGPTRAMMAAGRRARDLEGSPKVEFGTAADFFDRARAEYPDAPVWNGELYLELHRGTYSAQLGTKQGNRRSEHVLHEAELLAALAAVRTGHEYPYDELEELWQRTLLLQFHDILPDSSIVWVHREAERAHAEIAERAEQVIAAALAALEAGEGGRRQAGTPRPTGTPGPTGMRRPTGTARPRCC
ncbi:alpha-mannosidase [Brachybacterium aquaticum]|uniref:Alpha-mannosidase n=1 Tax=Brachybacterium aquaticum TaxID=1432564 RepID=A0A841A660_9MICO|nr:hypothetical protein [Brachybacterium aquaticum]MBB5830336.1 alpha-mannosidase [Brachybacterium aquaticum]